MAAKVSLREITDALEMQFDDTLSFLDPETGQVHTVSRDLLSQAEEDEAPDELPEWQGPEWELAQQITESGRFLRLPTQWDIHEWAIMQEFADSVERPSASDALQTALHGPGAFRYFKDTLRRYRLEQTWYAWRAQALRKIAVEWCREHGIPYQED